MGGKLYRSLMVIIRFPSTEVRRRALAFLLGRSTGKSWATGEVMVSESAISHLAAEGITFTVEGPATYKRILGLNKANCLAPAAATA
jgi:hypothetical protein